MKAFDFKNISEFTGPEESPGFLLWRASTLWRREVERVLKPLDLTHPQFVVLATTSWLTRNGNPVSQAEIGRECGLDPNTISQILRGLEAKGMVERKHTKDERSKTSTLTSMGFERLKEALPAVEMADRQYFSIVHLKNDSGLETLKKLARILKT